MPTGSVSEGATRLATSTRYMLTTKNRITTPSPAPELTAPRGPADAAATTTAATPVPTAPTVPEPRVSPSGLLVLGVRVTGTPARTPDETTPVPPPEFRTPAVPSPGVRCRCPSAWEP